MREDREFHLRIFLQKESNLNVRPTGSAVHDSKEQYNEREESDFIHPGIYNSIDYGRDASVRYRDCFGSNK